MEKKQVHFRELSRKSVPYSDMPSSAELSRKVKSIYPQKQPNLLPNFGLSDIDIVTEYKSSSAAENIIIISRLTQKKSHL